MPENSNIVSLETVIVDIPLKRLQRFARFDARAQSSLIVRIRCKSGVEGIGESIVPCGPWWSGDSIEAMQIMVERYIAPEIIGLPALHVDPIMARLAKSVRGANFAKTGVEMALMDLAGKLAGQPVHVLLGGRARSACPVAWPIASGDHDEDAAEMNHMLENGFACAFKVKMGATEIDADVARIRKLLDALDGRAGLRVDPNEAWQETDALRVMPMLEEAGVELVEQPVPREQMAAMANITARARVPVMIDEGAQSRQYA